jgi:diguanylate cyclase (GGDEF)-like protein
MMKNDLPVAISILSTDFTFIKVSVTTSKLIGLPRKEIIGKKCYDIVGQYKDDPFKKGMEKICDDCACLRCIQSGESSEMVRESDQNTVSHILAIPLKNKSNEIIGMLEIIENIAEKVSDPMTGVYNYRFYDEIISQECYRSRRTGASSSIILIDLNNFKAINDTHGHAKGDQVLRSVAQTLNSEIRKSDRLCRLGGDEFVIIAPDSGLTESEKLADRINETIKKKFANYNLSFSYGVATILDDTDDPKKLREIADERLYKHKEYKTSEKLIFKPQYIE